MSFETARGTVHSWQCDPMRHANLRAYKPRTFPEEIAIKAKEFL